MTDAATLSDEDFRRFLALIYRVSGICIPTTKRVLVSNRVRRRLRATGIGDFAAYYAYLTSPAGAVEMPRFLDEITTNETYFFRDPHQYAWLGGQFLREVVEQAHKHARPRRLRIWSAAASNGAELYSIALTIEEHRALVPRWPVTLLGTDLSEAMLEEARAGSYDERTLRLVAPEQRKRYFTYDAAARRWTIRPEIRALATWKVHNLLRPLGSGGPFDCIFLKNVLIYFDAASKQAVARHVLDALAPRGYLVLGPTEMIPRMLEPLERRQSWLYQRPA
jgi:chemotaxis protein methyltransferase CheR